MGILQVLVANEPRSYREAIAQALRQIRPGIEVFEVEPEALDREVMDCLEPCLVLCSRLTPTVTSRATSWMELYPGGESTASMSVLGVCATIPDVCLSDLLLVVDRTETYLASVPS